ncbi:uncharacterized protein N7503_008430 [Penicillium pulvis]|uniref:uncharacterized protein n=1 Tax=Penicillium pulvis TaxID=1562058 RepID=UPI002549238B|nr:uncharacterized protein N7503_008430 [Penicillium pulvis]KAJ5792452.1 hypothetical protein N7503_008430 [Penicillium pulvis]
MPSGYALKRTHGQEKVIIYAADLYLLAKWKNGLSISDEAQRSAIFNKWRDIGLQGRMPYLKRLEKMSKAQEDITEDEKDFLARVRDPSDRKEISYTRLVRTFYGNGSENNLSKLILEAEYDGTIFDNIALYDARSDNGLQSLHGILTHIPQIIEGTTVFACRHDNRIREALKKAIDKDGDEIDFEMAHQAARWTHVLIYDKEANDGPGNVLVVYIDDRGRVLRYSRLEGNEDLWAADGMFLSGQDFMRAWWENGRYGEDWKPEQLVKRWEEAELEMSEDIGSENAISE